jgi:hypothetical protein
VFPLERNATLALDALSASLPAVLMLASFVSVIAAVAEMSAFEIVLSAVLALVIALLATVITPAELTVVLSYCFAPGVLVE